MNYRVGAPSKSAGRFALLLILLLAVALHPPMAVSGAATAVGGRVFFDTNGNGRQDAGEAGLQGVSITLEGWDENGLRIERSTVSNEHGTYYFPDLPTGTFVLKETDPAGYLSTTPNRLTVTISSPQSTVKVCFGDALPITLWGAVFEDLDADSEQGLGEPGLPDVRLDLYADPDGDGLLSPSQTPLRTTYTSADGLYIFHDLLPGHYVLQETDPEQFGSLTPNQVALFLRSSEIGNEYTCYFGDVRLAAIGGRAWVDSNENGMLDAREDGMAGVLVTAQGEGGKASAVSDSDGHFRMEGLLPGEYVITANPPFDFTLTSPQSISVSLRPGEELLTLQIGLRRLQGDVRLGYIDGQSLDRAVELRWFTSYEGRDHAGFHVYRSLEGEDCYQRVTAELIAALAPGVGGASYTWRDTAVEAGTTYYYRLSNVRSDGYESLFGPVAVTVGHNPGGKSAYMVYMPSVIHRSVVPQAH